MDVYKFAMKMEEDGKNYYNSLEEKSENKGIKKIFSMLAQDEQTHYDVIMNYQKKVEMPQDSKTLEDAKNIFELLHQSQDKLQIVLDEDALRHAMDMEKKSIEFYENQSKMSENLKEKEIFNKLIKEEKEHLFLVETLLNHISGGILQGIESAEFQKWEIEHL